MKIGKPESLRKATALSDDEQRRVLSRMGGELPGRQFSDKLSVEAVAALQLEMEDEQLRERRENWARIRSREGSIGASGARPQAALRH